MNLVVRSTLVRAFAPWMDHLRHVIFRQSAAAQALLGPLMPVLFNYLGRLTRRLDRLVLAWESDRLPARRPSGGAKDQRPPPAARPESVHQQHRLPTRQNWLLRLHQPFVYYRGGIEQLLADPDTRALHAAAPQAGRLLRPLCRMFGVLVPDWLKLPKRPRKPRPPKPPRPESRTAMRRRWRGMTGAELAAEFGRLPPHFNLPIPGYQAIRRKIRAFEAAGGVRP